MSTAKVSSSSTAEEIDEFINDFPDAWMEAYEQWAPEGQPRMTVPASWEPLDSWHNFEEATDTDPIKVKDLGDVYLVDQHGGEGQGDDYHIVIRIKFLDGVERLFLKPGWHASHDGSYLDGDLYEVKPVERMVVFYE